MPTMSELFAEEEARTMREVEASHAADMARYALREQAREWIAANPGKQTADLPAELMTGFRELAHVSRREIRKNEQGGWVLAPEHMDEPETDNEEGSDEDADSEDE